MSDLFGLRGALILIGVLVVAGVWASGVWRGRQTQQARRLRPRRERSAADADSIVLARQDHGMDAADDLPPAPAPAPGSRLHGKRAKAKSGGRGLDATDLADRDLGLSAGADLAPMTKGEEAPEDLPSIQRDPGSPTAAGRQQIALDFEDAPSAGPEETAILVLNIESPERPIAGNDLVRAVTESGMRFGAMDIFHHPGLGNSSGGQPVFSMANLFEPGTFDIQRMDMFKTRGVSLFMQLPVQGLDGQVACELFVGSAERIAGALGCRLFNQMHQALSADDIDDMRRTARRYRARH